MYDPQVIEDEVVSLRQRSTVQWLPKADEKLIALVRARPEIYDYRHQRYADKHHKVELWHKIGRQLNTNPNACKLRWNSIRDNYRKWYKRKNTQRVYKYSSRLSFLERFLVHKTVDRKAEDQVSKEADEASDEPYEDKVVPDTQTEINTSYIKVDMDEQSEEEEKEQLVELEAFEESATSAKSSTQAQAVDAFLGALAPPLKELSPYLLSLAKAEIYAVVHKYELQGLRERGWDRDVDPLP